jgi:hypothetical protein
MSQKTVQRTKEGMPRPIARSAEKGANFFI